MKPFPRRRGSMAIALVLVVAIVAGTFAISLARKAVDERRFLRDAEQIRLLENAIGAVVEAGLDVKEPVRLPVDSERGEWILIKSIPNEQANVILIAQLIRNESTVTEIQRPGIESQ